LLLLFYRQALGLIAVNNYISFYNLNGLICLEILDILDILE
jgi:hypothetical protein